MDLSTLVKMSNTYGSNPAYVLAGGGNTSVKDDTTLYVKGSGTQLATIKAEEFVKMDRARLNEIMKTEYPADDVKRESAYLADVMAAVTDDDKTKRPSVEALLHNLFAYNLCTACHPTLIKWSDMRNRAQVHSVNSFLVKKYSGSISANRDTRWHVSAMKK